VGKFLFGVCMDCLVVLIIEEKLGGASLIFFKENIENIDPLCFSCIVGFLLLIK